MFLFIARHAWAGDYGDPRWPDDSQRPLTPAGIARYDEVIRTLAARGFAPAKIATSPYLRCRQTAEIIAARVPNRPPVVVLDALEPGSSLADAIAWTNDGQSVDTCWVGHNPDVERFVALLAGDGTANVRFAKGTIAALEFDEVVAEGAGLLYWLATAKLLGI